jgi:hypothetical protein
MQQRGEYGETIRTEDLVVPDVIYQFRLGSFFFVLLRVKCFLNPRLSAAVAQAFAGIRGLRCRS